MVEGYCQSCNNYSAELSEWNGKSYCKECVEENGKKKFERTID